MYFRHQEKLRNPHPLNPESIMIEHSPVRFCFPARPRPKYQASLHAWYHVYFIPRYLVRYWVVFDWPQESELRRFHISFPFSRLLSFWIASFGSGCGVLIVPSFLLFLSDKTLSLKAICISAIAIGRFIFGFPQPVRLFSESPFKLTPSTCTKRACRSSKFCFSRPFS